MTSVEDSQENRLEQILKPQPSLSSPLWRFTTVGIYGKSRLQALAIKLKTWGALKTFEFDYSSEPTIFIQGHTSPLTFDSPAKLWETMTDLYKTFTGGCKVIEIKIEPNYFNMVSTGFKLNELRVNDRDYQLGDLVMMGEVDKEQGYTGRAIAARINWIVAGEEAERWLKPNHCNFGLSEIVVMDLSNSFP